MMKWEEKNRTDGKGVYYETSTPGGRYAMVIQNNTFAPLWSGAIETSVYAPSLTVGPSYATKTAEESMRLCGRVISDCKL